MDGDGDMLLAMSDMHIIKQLNPQIIDESRDLLCGADLVVCDGNLSAKTIERLSPGLRQTAVSRSGFHGMGEGASPVYRML